MKAGQEDESTIFGQIYDRGGWWGLGSGPGSSSEYNKPFLDFLADFISRESIRSIVDYGCGDWRMFSEYQFGDTEYLGVDVVRSVVDENRKRYLKPGVDFRLARPLKEEDYSADLILMKDVMIHLPNDRCAEFLDFSMRSFRFGIFVNDMRSHEASVNEEIVVGGYRPVDIAKPPFYLSARTVLEYGSDFRHVFDKSSMLSRLFGRKVQTGRKHVQLVDFKAQPELR